MNVLKLVQGTVDISSYNILKLVQGSFNQGHPKYGETTGRQCVCNSIISIVWSKIRKVSLWRQSDLDLILDKSDKLCKSLDIDRYLDIDKFSLKNSLSVLGRRVCTKMKYS